ncbi:MAG TPA: glycoside hydrolase family 1 protein [Candidatus Entotheonella sp.]
MMSQIYHFPEPFMWGAATSSHQVEGGNDGNDWWAAEQAGQVPYPSGAACRHYYLYEQDFDLAQSWGHNAHRFSIEWSRIEPSEGVWDAAATAHYRDVIRALRQRGLEPVVTLHHFTNPHWFARRGGWLRRDSAALFARYADYVLTQVGRDVTYWLTLNEPTVYLMQGYVNGEWPPFVHASWHRAMWVCHRLARAHVAAYRIMHQKRPDIQVGFAHSAPWVEPCNPARWRDRLAAAWRDRVLNDAFFQLLGAPLRSTRRGQRSLDFLGLNYYTRTVVRSTGIGLSAVLGRACHEPHHVDQGPLSDIAWEVYPAGLSRVLDKYTALGLPLLITENGIATQDEDLRSTFLHRHLVRLGEALERGVPVTGYLYWSLIDNFEWAEGSRARFGLAAVDYQTQQRSPRPCADLLAQVCQTRCIQVDPPAGGVAP